MGSAARLNPSFRSLVRSTWIEELDRTSFLTRCRAGSVSRHELVSFVRQHHYYSRNFTRFLFALAANLEEEDDRRALTDNLFDEMGLGDAGNVSHAEMYRAMMKTMKIELDREPILPSTQGLIDTMFECCKSPRAAVGLGALCLGAEAIVPHLYSTILHGFASISEPHENLTFFAIHVEADDAHADTMRKIIERELDEHPASRVDLEYGAARALSARVAFFNALS